MNRPGELRQVHAKAAMAALRYWLTPGARNSVTQPNWSVLREMRGSRNARVPGRRRPFFSVRR
jgi:hypothetical protein